MTGKYTVAGSPRFDNKVDEDLSKIIQRVRKLPQMDNLVEIVLLGGYGRGEGTPYKSSPAAEEEPYNDYDLVVVTKPLWPWQHKKRQRLLNQLAELLEQEMDIAVDLYLHTTDTLKFCEPSLLNIEMKWGHRKIWGAADVLAKMPCFPLSQPPLSEGTRLLMNRGRLLLQVGVLLDNPKTLPRMDEAVCRKYLYKNALAFGDCILIAHGDYDLLYQNKQKRIENHRHDKTIPYVDIVIDSYQQACRFKLYGNSEDLTPGDIRKTYESIRKIYPQFLLWYESKRLQCPLRYVEDYCDRLAKQADDYLLKTIVLNMLLFGPRMFQPSSQWALVHPRRRLPPAICLLLTGSNQELANQLLGCKTDSLKRFQKLAKRLA